MVSPEKALALAESAVEHSGALDPLAHGYAHMRLALLRMQAHDLEAALAEALLGQAVFQQLGHAKHNASVLETLRHIYLWRGELDSAELSLREFQTFAQSTGWERGNAHAQRHLAQIAFLRSEWNATIGLGTPLLSPCKASFDLALEEALLGSELAMAHALMGNSKEALALAISAAQPTNSALVWARLCCIGEWAKHAEAPLWRNEAQRLSQKPESDASQKWALELLNSLAPPCEQGDPNAQVNRQWLRSISKFT